MSMDHEMMTLPRRDELESTEMRRGLVGDAGNPARAFNQLPNWITLFAVVIVIEENDPFLFERRSKNVS